MNKAIGMAAGPVAGGAANIMGTMLGSGGGEKGFGGVIGNYLQKGNQQNPNNFSNLLSQYFLQKPKQLTPEEEVDNNFKNITQGN